MRVVRHSSTRDGHGSDPTRNFFKRKKSETVLSLKPTTVYHLTRGNGGGRERRARGYQIHDRIGSRILRFSRHYCRSEARKLGRRRAEAQEYAPRNLPGILVMRRPHRIYTELDSNYT